MSPKSGRSHETIGHSGISGGHQCIPDTLGSPQTQGFPEVWTKPHLCYCLSRAESPRNSWSPKSCSRVNPGQSLRKHAQLDVGELPPRLRQRGARRPVVIGSAKQINPPWTKRWEPCHGHAHAAELNALPNSHSSRLLHGKSVEAFKPFSTP